MQDDEFKEHFAKFGTIVEAKVLRDSRSGKSKGFGFVTFADPLDVDKCLVTKHHLSNGREVDVKRTAVVETPPAGQTLVRFPL